MPSPPKTVYVASDDTGHYECDGIDDDEEINEAFDYVGRDEIQGTVYLQGPATYNISSQLLIENNSTLTGDPTACIRLVDNANWDKEIPLIGKVDAKNINIHGFEIDGNHTNQNVDIGKFYYTMIHFNGVPYNINIYNMYLHDNSNDIIKIQGGYQNVASNIHDNIMKNPGHEAVYVIAAKNVNVHNNTMNNYGNAGIRTYNSDGFSFHDNYIYGSGGSWGILIDEEGRNSNGGEIYNNVIYNTPKPGIMACTHGAYEATSVANLKIHNNVIYETGYAGIEVNGWDNVLIENNTIDKCSGNGIRIFDFLEFNPIITGICHVIIRNNTITNTTGKGIGVYEAGHSLTLEYNNLWNNVEGNYFNIQKGANDISVDPLFGDINNHDYHLKSIEGRWNNNTWILDTVQSQLINAGDPYSNYSNEPLPNGGRVNIGAYGNTAFASKSGTTIPPPTLYTLNILSNPTGAIIITTKT